MGLQAVYQRPRTIEPHPDHLTYPYQLKPQEIMRPNQVRCAGISFVSVSRGYLCLAATMD